MNSFEDISFKSLLLHRKDLKNTRRRLYKKLERLKQKKITLFENRLYCQCRFYFQGQRSIFKHFFQIQPLVKYIFDCGLTS